MGHIKKTRVTFYLDSAVYKKFKEKCDKVGLTYSKKIQIFIEDFVGGEN